MAQFDKGILGNETERCRLKIVLQSLRAHLDCNACFFCVLRAQAKHLCNEAGDKLIDSVDEGIGGELGRSLLSKTRVRLRYELDAL